MKKLILTTCYTLAISLGVYLFAYKQGQIDMMQSRSAIFNICEDDCYLEMSVRKVIQYRLPEPINFQLVGFITYCKQQLKEKPEGLQASVRK
ncbi:hypothetical protein [Chondrinema litorale]|uniref:hypothetical protein n=1 Tax=Chondrinema litorale TaxID=2994555 RepID=UPI0025427D4E|nr:hypothetical protein [Chondrinema litorale]UZR94268.1 hypothetical protein OQ292_00365 [Chondrinema litorale]